MDVNAFIAISAGVLSFFSPCVLPLIPSFLIYLSGASISDYGELSSGTLRKQVVVHSLAAIAGFSLVFILMGLSSSLVGKWLMEYQTWITRIGGALLILMGLNSLGVFKIGFLNQEKTLQFRRKPVGLLGSFVVGITFALGWTPCVGPVLSSILIIAATTSNAFEGMYLLSLYSLGLAVPFFVAAVLVGQLLGLMRRYGGFMQYMSKAIGILLILIGLLLITGYFTELSSYLLV